MLARFLQRWCTLLGLQRQTPASWHRARVREELAERHAARSTLERLSETSDVLFALARATHDGYPLRRLPRRTGICSYAPYAYMLAKYSTRASFYRVAGRLCGVKGVKEVVNPAKDSKLDEVAARHGIEKDKLRRVGGMLRRVWPLLP
ncbi:hypothetical protein BKA62DRAFT_206 [Auriculariales sp. MPI-PUGE-AT-0066]|nr:hypothetical protein BKA62DRAFT_206 [Auriculariales sp. MPI-PUGE-AT-0066]